MTIVELEQLLQRGEGIDVEFKTTQFELSKNVFESICAFLNRNGGHLLLGVSDNGNVKGVLEDCIDAMVKNLVTTTNNPGKFNPPCSIMPEILDYDGKKIIYVYVPQSAKVHSVNGMTFDRNGDGDLNITRQSWLLEDLYLRKQRVSTENRVIPYFELADCNEKVMKQARLLAASGQKDHPWLKMSDKELIRSAGMYRRDIATGKSGMTLAAALLLGKDETIISLLSHHRTDALVRIENIDRYDDRDDIRTNLIDSYDRLMAFIAKHLPDRFFLEGDQRISLRSKLFREIVSNLLIHREFAHPFPAKLIIERHRVYTENWNRPHGWGPVEPSSFDPVSKNPVIANFFREIGRADELGSGIRNLFKYGPGYTGGMIPKLVEGDIFTASIPWHRPTDYDLTPGESGSVAEDIHPYIGLQYSIFLNPNERKIMEILGRNPKTTIAELAKEMGVSKTTIENNIANLKKQQFLKRKGADKNGYWAVQKRFSTFDPSSR